MGYDEFLNALQRRGSNPYSIKGCYGTRDAWKWVRRGKWKALKGQRCPSSTYSEVIRLMNLSLLEMLLEGHKVELPYQMGTLALVATPSRVSIKDGKPVSNYRTDWKRTLQYWYEDPQAMREHKRIKRIQDLICRLHYSKRMARYRNQRYYAFRPNRSLVRTLGRRIENQKLNALIY